MNRSWWALRVLMIGMISVVSVVGAGCDSVVDRALAPDVETSTSSELVAEATEYGDWALPGGGKVLLVKREIIRDRRYQIAVEMAPVDFDAMLTQSRFAAAFQKLYVASIKTTIAGPDLASSPNVRSAQDMFLSQKGKSMIRDVIVDERNAETWVVHIDFRGV